MNDDDVLSCGKPDAKRRRRILTVRLTDKQKDLIFRAAHAALVSQEEFVRHAAFAAAEQQLKMCSVSVPECG